MDFTGLSAFPLTPMAGEQVDWRRFQPIIQRLSTAKVNSIAVLGSTGCYPYLSIEDRRKAVQIAIDLAEGIPVMAGVGALRTRDVLTLTEQAQQAGAAAVLLAPVSYQPLNDDEVFALYETVSRALSVPLCVYHNPRTTQFTFSPELLARVAALPGVGAVKIPPAEVENIDTLRASLPTHIRFGISGDARAAEGLIAGCDMWCSVIGGLFPQAAMQIVHAISAGNHEQARQLSARLAPLWEMFTRHGGGIRVIATAAEIIGVVSEYCLPAPLQTLRSDAREELTRVLHMTGLVV